MPAANTALDVDDVFHRHRYAVPRTDRMTGRARRVRGPRDAARVISVDIDEGMQFWIQAFDAIQQGVNQRFAGQFTAPKRGSKVGGGSECKIGRIGHGSSLQLRFRLNITWTGPRVLLRAAI